MFFHWCLRNWHLLWDLLDCQGLGQGCIWDGLFIPDLVFGSDALENLLNLLSFWRMIFVHLRFVLLWLFQNNHLEFMVFWLETAITFSFLKKAKILNSGCWLFRASFFEFEAFVGVVAAPAEIRLSPRDWHFYTASATVAAAFKVFNWMIVIDRLHKLLNLYILFLVVIFKTFKGTHPSLFYELIITGKLPCHFLRCLSRSEVIVCIHRTVSDVLLLHHVLRLELDWEERGVEVEFIDVFDVDDVDGAFGKLMGDFEGFEITWMVRMLPLKDLGMLE